MTNTRAARLAAMRAATGTAHSTRQDAPDELHTRAPEVWCAAVELATLSPDALIIRAFRRHSDAVRAWSDDHDGRHPAVGTTLEQRQAARQRAVERAV
jgi:hypothetical protein